MRSIDPLKHQKHRPSTGGIFVSALDDIDRLMTCADMGLVNTALH